MAQPMPLTELIPMLLARQTERYVPGVQRLLVRDDFTPQWLADFDRHTFTSHQERLGYLRGHYIPQWEVEGESCWFKSGCLDYIRDGEVKMRKRSEYIPKLISDIVFVRSLVGYRETFLLTIPQAYIRPRACPVVMHWASIHGYPVSDWIKHQAHLQTRKYKTPEDALQIIRLVERRWILRYMVLQGKLDPQTYRQYKKQSAGRKSADEPIRLSTGTQFIQQRKAPRK